METTGLDHQKERIIEIGAVRFVNGVEKDKFTSLVYPQKKLPEEIIRLTGIKDEDLKDAPYSAEILPELLNFIGKDTLIAHNAPFDISFLKVEFARLGSPFLHPRGLYQSALDTAILARALIPELESHSLSRVADNFSIQGGVHHRAEDDARRCGQVFIKLTEHLLALSVSECTSAAKLLGKGAMAELFQKLTRHLAKTGAPVTPTISKPYSNNLLGCKEEIEVEELPDFFLEGIFKEGGILSQKLANFESRPRQKEMAEACAEALYTDKYLLAEAGTGTGKSFAYLAPAIAFSLKEEKRVVVSTNTKNLQEQLFRKDIPFLINIIPYKFQAALLKGRGNYLCWRKWKEVLADPDYFLGEEDRYRALPLLFWAKCTTTGDVAENNGFQAEKAGWLWNKFCSEMGACQGQNCQFYQDCFLQSARRQALNSHIVVVNHALVLTDIPAENSVLGKYQYLIVDEAHNLEKAVVEYLGRRLNIYKLRAFCFRLYKKDEIETGRLAKLRLLAVKNEKINELLGAAILDTNKLRSSGGEFFGRITETIHSELQSPPSQYTLKIRYGPNDAVIAKNLDVIQNLIESLVTLIKSLRRLSKALTEDGDQDLYDSGLEISALAEEAIRLAEDVTDLCRAGDSEWVYWWELPAEENSEVTLCSAPLNPGDILKEKFYPGINSIIFTSATLTVADDFNYIINRLGLDEVQRDELLMVKNFGTPFDYRKQAIFGVPVFLPGPKNTELFTTSLAELVADIGGKFKKGMLVLFTSHQQLNLVYSRIKGQLNRHGVEVLGQGIDGARSDLLRRFLSTRAVLLGTESFWEGIDAPGEALEILVIAKLPFEVPTEPLVQARSERIEREGGNPFLDYSVPEAVIKLKQGIGRLIRSKTDRGAVIICDNRIINSQWGSIFKDSLPGRVEIFRNKPELTDALNMVWEN